MRTPGALLDGLRGARIHVVGASGAEGLALLRFLAGEAGFEGIVAHDFSADPREFARSFRRANTALARPEREAELRALRALPIELRLGERYLEGLDAADVILASQNWFNYPSNLPALPDAIARGARLLGVVDLAMDLFPGTRVGVTGSNGKSTTTALLRHLLGAARPGARVLQGGNDRNAQVTLAALRDADPGDVLVWEVSNRHLRDRPVLVDVGVVTNITRNHIEDHGSWAAYVAAKLRLVGHAAQAVMSASDPESRQHLDAATGRLLLAGEDRGDSAWIEGDSVRLRLAGAVHTVASLADFPLPGEHNRANLLSALLAAAAAGARLDRLGPAVATVRPLPGRLETVAEQEGVRWIWDIQATTAPAAEAGIRAEGASRRLILLVGGDDKGMDYRGMADAAAASADRVLALPGSGSEAFLAALGGRVPVERHDELDPALARARAVAGPGMSVLCSPGCAFFFSRFVDGGPGFARRVRAVLR